CVTSYGVILRRSIATLILIDCIAAIATRSRMVIPLAGSSPLTALSCSSVLISNLLCSVYGVIARRVFAHRGGRFCYPRIRPARGGRYLLRFSGQRSPFLAW